MRHVTHQYSMQNSIFIMQNVNYSSIQGTPILPPPLPAQMGHRMIAFVLDSILAYLVGMLIIHIVILNSFDGSFSQEMKTFMDQYYSALEAMSNGTDTNALEKVTISETLMQFTVSAFTTLLLCMWLYFGLCEWLLKGKSLGKQVFNLATIQVLYQTPPRFAECLVRGGIKTLSLISLTLFMFVVLGNLQFTLLSIFAFDYFIAFFTPQRRTLHDYLSRTAVVQPSDARILDEIA